MAPAALASRAQTTRRVCNSRPDPARPALTRQPGWRTPKTPFWRAEATLPRSRTNMAGAPQNTYRASSRAPMS